MGHGERHRTDRIGWLRAAVLGANDGVVSTASLIVGVAASASAREAVLVAGAAGLTAGALAMAAGEYVSVSSQADTEAADRARERKELEASAAVEEHELATIYERRGLDPELARQVARQLTSHDALQAHLRDELGLVDEFAARPMQAAAASAATFACGAALPLIAAWTAPTAAIGTTVVIASLVALVALGAVAGRVGGASVTVGAVRVVFWGALAMGVTALVGHLFGAPVA